MSVDVSPDGSEIVFDLLGDLYSIPIQGGKAKPLTSGIAYDTQPRYSPDGKSIVFVSDRSGAENLWIMQKDGLAARQLSNVHRGIFTSPAWTPDGMYVTVSRKLDGHRGMYQLWQYATDGTGGERILDNAVGALSSPDGRWLYYAKGLANTEGHTRRTPLSVAQLARYDRAVGTEFPMTDASTVPGSAFRPVLSPDGTLLVYATRYPPGTALRVRNLRTAAERWLHYPVERDEVHKFPRPTLDVLPGYAFMPDGESIVIAYGGGIHRVDVESGKAQAIPFEANVELDVGPLLKFSQRIEDGPSVQARIIHDPVFSPDGDRLAFSALAHLYVTDHGEGSTKRLTEWDAWEFHPAWSPDGQWLAFVTWSPQECGHLWKIRADGRGQPERLTGAGAFYSAPTWSPDGTEIFLHRATCDAYRRSGPLVGPPGLELVRVPASGGEASTVMMAGAGKYMQGSSAAHSLGRPHFGPDRNRVYVRAWDHGLVSVDSSGDSGDDRRSHLRVEGVEGLGGIFRPGTVEAAEIRLSPDGRWALASVSSRLYLVPVPGQANDAVTVVVDGNSPSPGVRPVNGALGADYFGWSDGGRCLYWALGSQVERRSLAALLGEDETACDERSITVVVERPRRQTQGSLMLTGGRIVTMRGDEIIANGDVLVTGNRIAAVGPRGSIRVPADVRRIDATGTTIVPGFIDLHMHYWAKAIVLDPESHGEFLAPLAHGITTGFDPATVPPQFTYRDLVETGDMTGPRVLMTGLVLTSFNDYQSLDEMRQVVRRYEEYYQADALKEYFIGNRAQRQWLAMAAYEAGMQVTSEQVQDMKRSASMIIDGYTGHEHMLPATHIYDDVIQLMANAGTYYDPTLSVSSSGTPMADYFAMRMGTSDEEKLRRFIPRHYLRSEFSRRLWSPSTEYAFPANAASAADIVRAGGRVLVGSHGDLPGLGFHWEMWGLHAGGKGLTAREVLRAATLHGAEALGLDEDLGSIEPGKLADIVVLDQDPLKDIGNTTSIRYVIKNGVVHRADTLDQLWPEERQAGNPWWLKDRPGAN